MKHVENEINFVKLKFLYCVNFHEYKIIITTVEN